MEKIIDSMPLKEAEKDKVIILFYLSMKLLGKDLKKRYLKKSNLQKIYKLKFIEECSELSERA